MVALATIAVIIIVWGAFSAPLDRHGVTSAMVFVVAGFVAGSKVLGLLDVSVEGEVAQRVTEVALVLLLFSDAARLDLRTLRHELGWPSRLLLIGLPLTMLAGSIRTRSPRPSTCCSISARSTGRRWPWASLPLPSSCCSTGPP